MFPVADREREGRRWVIGEDLELDGGLAYVDTWSTDACRVTGGGWYVAVEGCGWREEPGLVLRCDVDPGGLESC